MKRYYIMTAREKSSQMGASRKYIYRTGFKLQRSHPSLSPKLIQLGKQGTYKGSHVQIYSG